MCRSQNWQTCRYDKRRAIHDMCHNNDDGEEAPQVVDMVRLKSFQFYKVRSVLNGKTNAKSSQKSEMCKFK